MEALRCPFCGYIWEPKVMQPRCCPRCKRHWVKDKEPVAVQVESLQEYKELTPSVGVYELEGTNYVMCKICADLGDDTEGPYEFHGIPHCLKHLFIMILEFDKTLAYKKADPVGMFKGHRETVNATISGVLETLPELELREESVD